MIRSIQVLHKLNTPGTTSGVECKKNPCYVATTSLKTPRFHEKRTTMLDPAQSYG